MTKLISFKNDPALKKMLLTEVIRHRKQDQIIQGTYGDIKGGKWKGCAVGCAIHSLNEKTEKNHSTSDHSVYETELGIPEWLARLEDTIFEGLPKTEAKTWPERFIKAIPVGVDLGPLKWKFSAYLMKENIDRVLSLNIADDLKKQVVDAIRGILSVHETAINTGELNETARSAAWSAARSAAESVRSAAESVRSARSARSAWSARSAAESAARSAWSAAESAAWSARSAAESAAWSARSAAESAAWSAAYQKHSKELLKMLEEAK